MHQDATLMCVAIYYKINTTIKLVKYTKHLMYLWVHTMNLRATLLSEG